MYEKEGLCWARAMGGREIILGRIDRTWSLDGLEG